MSASTQKFSKLALILSSLVLYSKTFAPSKKVSFQTLVNVFYGSHDPTTKNGQHPDYGSQYRSIAFYNTDNERKTIVNTIDKLKKLNNINNGNSLETITNMRLLSHNILIFFYYTIIILLYSYIIILLY